MNSISDDAKDQTTTEKKIEIEILENNSTEIYTPNIWLNKFLMDDVVITRPITQISIIEQKDFLSKSAQIFIQSVADQKNEM
jgi:hypothetical protein